MMCEMMKSTAMDLQMDKEQAAKLVEKLTSVGLRITAPRLQLAGLLFARGNRHVSAEQLHKEARQAGLSVSQATVYNTLNQFHEVGLLRQVQVDQARSYFDTNLDAHHHFYVEDEARLIDIEAEKINVAGMPDTPDGYDVSGVDVIIRLDKAQ